MDEQTAADEITWITDNVAITNFFSAHGKDILAEHNVKAVLCLDQETQGDSAEERGVECIEVVHLVDGPNDVVVFRRAVTTLGELIDRHGQVVVHCRAGRSRSIAVVAAYLKKARNLEADEALQFVMSRRQSAIAPELVRLVGTFDS